METVRPLDVLNRSKGKEVTVEMKNSQIYKGKLKAFDIHLNLVLFETIDLTNDKKKLVGDLIIRGDTITTIKNI
ncbi:MAG: LSM domain-containing protein [Nanoarchaeota archaeon]